MNTLEEFKGNMDWTMMELSDNQLEDIYSTIDTESYASMEDLEEDYDFEDNLIFCDVNLHCVLDNFSELIERGRFRFMTFFYLAEDDMYAGVYGYDY
jgi:hypothetical protein